MTTATSRASVGNCVMGSWPLNESGGTIARSHTGRIDPLGASYNGTITMRAPGLSTAIPAGITTDGSSGYVALPSLNGPASSALLNSSTDFQSWCIWSYNAADITSASAASWIIGSNASGYVPMGFGGATGLLTNEVVSISCDAGGANRRTGWSGFSIPAGWNFHVLTFNGTQDGWFYYLNGWPVTSAPGGGTKINANGGCLGFDGTQGYTIGRTSGSAYSAVTVAECSVYSHTLTHGEVARLYSAGKNGFVLDPLHL